MAVPRPVLLALLGVALCAAAFLATRGARDPGGAITSVPTPAPATPAVKPAKHAHAAKPASMPAVQDAADEAANAAKPAKPSTPAVPKAQATAVRVRVALD